MAKGITKSRINLLFIFTANVATAQEKVNKLQITEKNKFFLTPLDNQINANQEIIYKIVIIILSKLELLPIRKTLKFMMIDNIIMIIKAIFKCLNFINSTPLIYELVTCNTT